MQTEHKMTFLEWAINVIECIKTEYAEIGIVPTHFLREIFNFPTYQVYQIILEIDKSMYKYIKTTEIDDYNIIAMYYIDTNYNLIRNDIHTIERIIKTESRLDKIDSEISKYSGETLYICKIKNYHKAFILKRVFWTSIMQIFGEYLIDKLEVLKNIIDSFKDIMFENNSKLHSNKYLLTTYSDRNILTKITLKTRYSKYIEDEIEYKYILNKEYENAKILRYKPIIYKLFRKEQTINNKNLLPNKNYKETILLKDAYLANVKNIYQTVLLHDLLATVKLL